MGKTCLRTLSLSQDMKDKSRPNEEAWEWYQQKAMEWEELRVLQKLVMHLSEEEEV